MDRILLTAIALAVTFFNAAEAQHCAPGARYTARAIFSGDEISQVTGLRYGTAENESGEMQDLLLDIYYPSAAVDTVRERPLVVLIHGGGFRDGERQAMEFECREFARRGFVAATIDYRLGFDRRNPVDFLRAVYRAEQDALAALRYLGSVAMAYGVDANWVFLGGDSAGAISALNVNYVSGDDWAGLVPGIDQSLGAIGSSGNDLPSSPRARGIMNNWGSTLPSAVTAAEMVPTIAFHGELDEVVPIDTSALGLIGSRPIHQLLLNEGICSELTVVPDGRHGVFNDTLGSVGRVARAACFFKRLFCEECQSLSASELLPAACDDLVSDQATPLADPIRVYPNPSSGVLTVESLRPGTTVRVMTADGRVIHRGEGWRGQPLMGAPAGVYYLRFSRAGRSLVRRVVVL